jgi:zinc and cadmium transporter
MELSSLYALGSVLGVSLVSLVGLLILSVNTRILSRGVFFLVAVAAGALLGDAFFHLIPESFEEIANPTHIALALLTGIFSFFILEKYLHFHHEHDECRHEEKIKPVGPLILVSDSIHNILDGIIIGISYAVSIPVGVATTIAVIFHEIPQEIGDFGVLLHAGYSKSQALFYNFLSALGAIIGVVVVLLFSPLPEKLLTFALPFAAGSFIYIAMVDLVPELHKQRKAWGTFFEIVGISIGAALMYALLFLE